MPATVIVGLQWGDEGKGKTTDFLAEHTAMVVRYQGGDNAGHTVVVGDEVLKLQLCPSGVLYPHITSVIGNGVVVNPATLIRELDMLAAQRRRRVQGPREPQRARDHAVPRGPRQGQREPPRGRQGGHDRPRHRAHVRRPRLAPGPPDGGPGRRARPPRAHHPGPRGQEPAPRGDGRRALRGGAARRPVPRVGRAPRPAPRRLHLARPGRAPARRPRPPRGRPGHAAGPRPRLVPLRDLLQPGRRRRLHRRRHRPAPGGRGHRRHEGLRDPRGVRALPDRAVRRDRPRDRGARPRVRDRDRARPPRGLVRHRAAALRRRGQLQQRDRPQQARHPVRHRDDQAVRRLRDRRQARRDVALVRIRALARRPDLRGLRGLGGADPRRPLARRPARERPPVRVGARGARRRADRVRLGGAGADADHRAGLAADAAPPARRRPEPRSRA